jgi:hypothetical protein
MFTDIPSRVLPEPCFRMGRLLKMSWESRGIARSFTKTATRMSRSLPLKPRLSEVASRVWAYRHEEDHQTNGQIGILRTALTESGERRRNPGRHAQDAKLIPPELSSGLTAFLGAIRTSASPFQAAARSSAAKRSATSRHFKRYAIFAEPNTEIGGVIKAVGSRLRFPAAERGFIGRRMGELEYQGRMSRSKRQPLHIAGNPAKTKIQFRGQQPSCGRIQAGE